MNNATIPIFLLFAVVIISGCIGNVDTTENNIGTFEEAFAEIEKIPTTTSGFKETSKFFVLKGKIINETREAEIRCIREPCDVEPEKYNVYLFQDLVNETYKIQIEEKYLDQFSLEIGKVYVIKGNVVYLRKPNWVEIARFEPIQIV